MLDLERSRASVGAAITETLCLCGALETKKFMARSTTVYWFIGGSEADGALLLLLLVGTIYGIH